MATQYINKVTLSGNLGSAPGTRFTPSGTQVTTASLATNDTWTTESGEQQRRTEWHRLVFWRRMSEIASQYLSKGSRLFVEGRLQTRTWEDARGQRHCLTEIIVTDMKLLDAPGGPGELDMTYGGGEEERNYEQLTFAPEISSPQTSLPLRAPGDDGLPF